VEPLEYWSIWYPKAGATGVLLARAAIGPTATVLFHSAPDVVTVEVASGEMVVASGRDLKRTLDSPMCRLRREGSAIVREDCWPASADVGGVVVLPGGEAGRLTSWWNAEDRKEWRWAIELHNSIREEHPIGDSEQEAAAV
jgi:hypothetical protein